MRYLACHERKARGTFDFPIELYYVDPAHPRYEMPFHWHMECEFILILEGTCSITLDSENRVLQKGACVFIPGGVIHGGTPQNCIYECVVFDLERFLHDSAICREKLHQLLGPGTQLQYWINPQDSCAKLIDGLFEAMETEQPGYEFVTTGLLWQFVGAVFQQHLYTETSEKDAKSAKRASQMKNVLRRIRNDYAATLTLEDLAAEAAMTPKYFCAVFQQVTGRTPIDYLNYYRIECAAELLCSTTENVTTIALSCGFNDLSYFVRLFRRHKGMCAKEYRKQHSAG